MSATSVRAAGTPRRGPVAALALALLALAATALVATPGAHARTASADRDGRPNILVVMTDDQALSDVAQMPNVKRLLAAQGTTFSDAVDSFPLCCPARATFITGQYAHNHGVAGNFYPYGWYGMKHRSNTLPVWLRRAGYRTAMIGKWLNGYGALKPREIPPGFDIWRGLLDVSAYDYFNFIMNVNGRLRSWGDRAYAQALVDFAKAEALPGIDSIAELLKLSNRLFRPGWFGTQETKNYSPDVTGRVAEELVRGERRSRKPFFIWWSPASPHREDVNGAVRGKPGPDPRPAPRYASRVAKLRIPRPPSFNEADVSAKPRLLRELPKMTDAQIAKLQLNYQGRIGSLLAVDDHVKKLVSILRQTGQLSNTLIVFVSDNGWVQGQHRILGDKFVPYQESIRVPFILRGPGVRAGRTVRRTVSNIDFAPTLLAAARARAGRTQDGISLLPAAAGRAQPPARAIELEATGPLFMAEGFPMAYDKPYKGVLAGPWKYIRWSYGDQELYDLRRDPYEMRNLAADPAYAATKARLAAKLRALERCKGRACDVRP